jgi:hypothetical protein
MDTITQIRYFAGSPRLYAASTRSGRPGGTALPLSPGAGLLMALALSLGLWGAIWLAVSRFALL